MMDNFNYGEGVKPNNSNIERMLTPEIWGLLETLVKLGGIKTKARELIMKQIIEKMENL